MYCRSQIAVSWRLTTAAVLKSDLYQRLTHRQRSLTHIPVLKRRSLGALDDGKSGPGRQQHASDYDTTQLALQPTVQAHRRQCFAFPPLGRHRPVIPVHGNSLEPGTCRFLRAPWRGFNGAQQQQLQDSRSAGCSWFRGGVDSANMLPELPRWAGKDTAKCHLYSA